MQSSEDHSVNRPIIYTTYDNLDEAIEVQQYDGDGVTITSSGGVPAAPARRCCARRSIRHYDDQGRVYQTQVYDVDPATGAVSTARADDELLLRPPRRPGGRERPGRPVDQGRVRRRGPTGVRVHDRRRRRHELGGRHQRGRRPRAGADADRLRRRRQRHRDHRQPASRQRHGHRPAGPGDRRRRAVRLLHGDATSTRRTGRPPT